MLGVHEDLRTFAIALNCASINPYLLLLSLAKTLPTKYFMNCGSKSNITVSGQNFVGDLGILARSLLDQALLSGIKSSTYSSLYQIIKNF
ncbi:hypothetical protein SLA2020_496020 [Shorea laevis]